MFQIHTIELQEAYARLSTSCAFEDVARGRKGATLVDDRDEMRPLVRTTTQYMFPNQAFAEVHHELCGLVRERVDAEFNNVLIELYSPAYRKMKYHTDQALDLDGDSYICLYSCYDIPNIPEPRILEIVNKETNSKIAVPLLHNSIVAFSTRTNAAHVHRIMSPPGLKANWIGGTLRRSATFLFWERGWRFTSTGTALRLASDEERMEFFRLKKKENEETAFVYPKIEYTVSPGDLLSNSTQ
jgi:hypothetical protein